MANNNHHRDEKKLSSLVREIVFGMEDGMVSTLGAISGIAVGSQDKFMVILSGLVIIAVESISMGIGSYLSNRSQREVERRLLQEEREEIEKYPQAEKKELEEMYKADGWPAELAKHMSEAAASDKRLMLKEMAYRELSLIPGGGSTPLLNAMAMYFSYIGGGLVPLFAYFFLPIKVATPLSIVVTLIGLFTLGVVITKYTKKSWWKSGLRIMLIGGLAFMVGMAVGEIVKYSK